MHDSCHGAGNHYQQDPRAGRHQARDHVIDAPDAKPQRDDEHHEQRMGSEDPEHLGVVLMPGKSRRLARVNSLVGVEAVMTEVEIAEPDRERDRHRGARGEEPARVEDGRRTRLPAQSRDV